SSQMNAAPSPAPESATGSLSSSHAEKAAKNNAEEPVAAAAPAAARADDRAAADPALSLARRADGLMHAGRWNDAITCYRELLRRYPKHPSAADWRQRLA